MNTKKYLITLLTCALLLVMLVPAMAQDSEPMAEEPVVEATPAPLTASTDFFVMPYFRVNVRSGPSTAYTVLGVVSPADSVDITGRNESGSWLRLNFNGQEGWVFGDLMDITGDIENAPISEAGASAVLRSEVPAPVEDAETEAGAEESGELVIMTFFNTNLRDSYTTEAEVVATIPFDTVLTPQGRTDDSDWIMVTVDEQSGWVYAPILFFASGEVESLPVLATVSQAEAMTP